LPGTGPLAASIAMRHSLIFLFLLLNASAFAESISLDALPSRVVSHHPGLKAARLAIAEAKARQIGAGRLANPTAGFEFQNESRVSPRVASFALDQSFPVTRRLRLEKQLTAQLVTAAELEVREAERHLIAEARRLAVNLLALDQQRSLRQQQTLLAQELVTFTQSRAEAGELSPLDAAQARVDAQRLPLESRRIETERLALLGALKPLLGLTPEDDLQFSSTLPDLKLPPRGPWHLRPDYQLAQTREQTALTESELAKSRRWQDLNAGLFAAREQQDLSSSQTEHTGFVGLRLSIPLPLWNRNQGEIAEKAASAERARLETTALATSISHEAATARREMEAHAALARETRDKLLPLVNEQAASLQKAFEAGQTDLLSLLRAREQRLQIQATILDANRDFHLARIRYETALGLNP
jgi:cobalt-zinc-cadmium efflux system outer membrane protein